MLPKITIITPSFNQGDYLEETILSVLGQEYPNLEFFVFDGGSTDSSISILEKYDHQIDYWESTQDRGQSHAINKGLKKATGDFITWLNSDDVLLPKTLEKIAEITEVISDQVGVIHGGSIPFTDKKEFEADFGYQNLTAERYLSGMAFPQPAAFIKKKYFDKVGLLGEGLHYGMDYDLFSQLSLVCDFYPVDEVFSKNRLHTNSKTTSDQMGFFTDWNQVFIRRIQQLELTRTIELIQELPFLKLPKYEKLGYPYMKPEVDEELLTFYHVCYLLKYSYWTGEFSISRKLKKFLFRHYDNILIDSELEIKKICRRLIFPSFFILFIRKTLRIYN